MNKVAIAALVHPLSWLCLTLTVAWATAQGISHAPARMRPPTHSDVNFNPRCAIQIQNAPRQIELSKFNFYNTGQRSRTDLTWKNVSDKSIIAFEIVILRYDPFNRPIHTGRRWLIPGRSSRDWSPLLPGQSSSDSLTKSRSETVLTAIAYVSAIRYVDGTVWQADIESAEKQIREKIPALRELGAISPALRQEEKR
jgi:hypothetical protein